MSARMLVLSATLTLVGGVGLAHAMPAAHFGTTTTAEAAPQTVQYYGYERPYGYGYRRHPLGWFPGKGNIFCREHPENYRCHRHFY